MTDPVTAIRNVGAVTAAAFADAGVTTAAQVRDMGADAAYLRLLDAGVKPHFLGYCALVMGLMDRPWNDARGAEKAELKQRYDRLLSGRGNGTSRIEAALDQIGVGLRR